MRLLGAHAEPEVSGLEEQPGRTNYVRGGSPKGWRTGVAGYARVMYRGVYEGVDLVYYGNQQRFEYDFRLAPGASAGRIRLSFEGHDSARVEANGDLVLRLADSEVRQLKPFAYQENAGGARV